MTRFYKCFVNQPSTLQLYHKHHGRYGTALDAGHDKVRIIFDGNKHEEMFIDRIAISQVS